MDNRMKAMGPKLPYILCLDDDGEFGKILSMELDKLSLQYDITSNAKDFLDIIAKNTPSLCLIDLNICNYKHGREGFALINIIRSHYGVNIPIMVISCQDDLESKSMALKLGANDYLGKPLDSYLFFVKINKILRLEDINEKYARVPGVLGHCELSINLKISGVAEHGLYLESDIYCAKRTSIKISGDLLHDIFPTRDSLFLSVHHVRILKKDIPLFEMYLPFPLNDQELLTQARLWITKKKCANSLVCNQKG